VFLQQLRDQLYPAQGDTSYRALACEVASTVGITMVLLCAVLLVPLHYGHYLCPLSGPLQLHFDLPGWFGLISSLQPLMPLVLNVPVSWGLSAVLRQYFIWSFRAAGLDSALSPPAPATAPAGEPAALQPPQQLQHTDQNATAPTIDPPHSWMVPAMIPTATGALCLIALFFSWAQRAPLVVGRWVMYCLSATLGEGYTSPVPDWESDLLAYPVGLYVCTLIARYVWAMLGDTATAVQEALAQRSDPMRTWSAALHTTLSAAQAPLWVWLQRGGKVVIAFALWLPCMSLLPGMLALCNFTMAGRDVMVRDAATVARLGFNFAQSVLP
jgi:hypothetical protein